MEENGSQKFEGENFLLKKKHCLPNLSKWPAFFESLSNFDLNYLKVTKLSRKLWAILVIFVF
jgi:hypothetical protein